MFHGSMVALVTPMTPDGAVDDAGLARLVEFHVEQGTDAIVSVGTTGESATLDMAEHIDVIGRTVELAAGRVPVIAGTGANSTWEALELTREAQRVGADACLLVTPYYNKPTQEGLYQHFRTIAEAVDIPQILYNVPSRTACDMLPETVARLAEIPNIVGLKEATSSLERGRDLVQRCGSEFAIVSGEDAATLALMREGFVGTISVTANVAPRAMHDMCAAALAGRHDEAATLNDRLDGLHRALFVEPNPIPVKWALHRMGLIDRGIRLPMTWLTPQSEAAVERAMNEAGVL